MRSMARISRFFVYAAACVVLVGLSGCDKGPTLYQVSGTVTHDSKPLTGVTIYFSPVAGGRPSVGNVDENGRFSLRFTSEENGAVAGEHIVYVEYTPADPDELMKYEEGTLELAGDMKTVLDKYGNEESPYQVTVDADVQDLEIKLD